MYQHRFNEALRDAKQASRLCTGKDHAKAQEALGVTLYYLEDYRGAIRELGLCLEETDPNAETAYCNAIQNYLTALAMGTDDEAVRAIELCDELRPRLKLRHKMQRAKLWWTRGLLHKRLGETQEAWRAFEMARRSLTALQAVPELVALVAEMAELAPDPPVVQVISREAEEVLPEAHSLAQPLRTLASSAREMIPEAAAALKQAAAALAPCPAL